MLLLALLDFLWFILLILLFTVTINDNSPVFYGTFPGISNVLVLREKKP